MRRLLLNPRAMLAGAGLSATAVFAAMVHSSLSTVSVSHFIYIPIALAALAAGPWIGAAAGFGAAGLTAAAFALNPALGQEEPFPFLNMTERLVSYVLIGTLIGWSAATNRELLERLRHHAERDFLTGLLNMRAFEAALASRIAAGRPFTLLLGDVDDLKRVNDSLGHVEGNELLRRVAAACQAALSQGDQAARIGGDEFAILRALETPEHCEAAAQQLEASLRAGGVAVSFGWAVFPADGRDALALFHAADKRLYEDKSGPARPGFRLHSVS